TKGLSCLKSMRKPCLPPGAVLVEVVRFRSYPFRAGRADGPEGWGAPRYLAFVLHAGAPDELALVDLGEAEPLAARVRASRAGLTGARAPSPAGEGLRRAAFDPLLPALKGRMRLFVSPDGALTRLPLEVLPAGRGRLIDEYAISYVAT